MSIDREGIDEKVLDQKLKDQLKKIELGEDELFELYDPEDYEDQGGIKSLDKKPSIKLAGDSPEEEFTMELLTLLDEYKDAVKEGYSGSFSDYADEYFGLKKMANGGRMQLADGMPKLKSYPDPITARIETEKEEAAQVRDNKKTGQYPVKKTRKNLDLDIQKIQDLIDKQKEEKEKKARGGIAGVL